MIDNKITQMPEVATGKSKLATEAHRNVAPQLAAAGEAKVNYGGLWDIRELMKHIPICRRSVHNLRRKGLPTIVLGRRLFWHPASVESWLLRQQRGADQ